MSGEMTRGEGRKKKKGMYNPARLIFSIEEI
jgi:hypothetical protein